MTVSWPDYLEDFINNEKVKVYNIGWPDAGPVEYIRYWKENFKILKHDLVLINFTYTDFYRGTPSDRQTLLKFQGREINGSFKHQYKFDKGNAEMSVSIFPGSKKYKTIDRKDNKLLVDSSLEDPFIVPSRPYGLFLDKTIIDDDKTINELKAKIVDEMIKGAIKFYKCILCNYLLGNLKSVHGLRNFDVDKQTNLPPLDRKILIKFGSEKFNWLIEIIPNIYFFINFSYPNLVNNTPVDFADDLKRVNKNFDYIDMRKYFSTNDLKKSFYLPWMVKNLMTGHD